MVRSTPSSIPRVINSTFTSKRVWVVQYTSTVVKTPYIPRSLRPDLLEALAICYVSSGLIRNSLITAPGGYRIETDRPDIQGMSTSRLCIRELPAIVPLLMDVTSKLKTASRPMIRT